MQTRQSHGQLAAHGRVKLAIQTQALISFAILNLALARVVSVSRRAGTSAACPRAMAFALDPPHRIPSQDDLIAMAAPVGVAGRSWPALPPLLSQQRRSVSPRIVGAPVVDVAGAAATHDLTVDSPAVGTVKVRVLVPQDYDREPPSKRFPVLTLLHGGGGDDHDWDQRTRVEAYTAAA